MEEFLKQLEAEFLNFKRLRPLRSIFEIVFAYGLIALCIMLTLRISWWLYIPALLLIGNRQHTLALLGHEAVHGTLFKNPRVNNFIGKLFCHYPVGISYHRYKIQHLLHHRFLGSRHDPDLEFYIDFPKKRIEFLRHLTRVALTGRIILFFLEYYNGLRVPFFPSRRFQVIGSGDHRTLLLFWILIFCITLYFEILPFLFLFWILPFVLWLPWLLFKVTLEHAPMTLNGKSYGQSRSIISSPWIETLLFPVDINYHSEHHLFPWIPHYYLPSVAAQLAEHPNKEMVFQLNLRHMNLKNGIHELWQNDFNNIK